MQPISHSLRNNYNGAIVTIPSVKLKNIKNYTYDIRLETLREYRIDESLKALGLRRKGKGLSEKNSLLQSIFRQLPKEARGDFQEFKTFVRNAINKTHNEKLSLTNKDEMAQIFSSIQSYLYEKSRINYCFKLGVLFVDNDGNLARLDTDEQSSLCSGLGEPLSVQIIVSDDNYYEPLFKLGSNEARMPSYVINTPVKVDSDSEGSESSDEEIDEQFDPSSRFRLAPKRGSIVRPLLESNESKKRRRVQSLFVSKIEEEADRIKLPSQKKRIGVCLGFNKMRSLSDRKNRALEQTCNERIMSEIPVKKLGFFWDGHWERHDGEGWEPTNYEEVRHFYKQLKRFDLDCARTFRKEVEASRGPSIPYREIRDEIKNSAETKQLIQDFSKTSDDVYLTFLDSDLCSFRRRKRDPGMFSVLDENYLKKPFEIASTGYTIKSSKNRFLEEVAIEADLLVRQATSRWLKNGVYYPEPCAAVRVPKGQYSIPENFSDPQNSHYDSPKEMPRLIAEILKNRKLNPEESMVFDTRGAVVTTLPKRMEKSFLPHKTKKNGFIFWGIDTFRAVRDIRQSHYNARDWAVNLLPALDIEPSLKIDEYVLEDKKVLQDVVVSLLSRLFNAFDPVELAEVNSGHFRKNLIEVLNNYESHLEEKIPKMSQRKLKLPRKNTRDLKNAEKKCQAVNQLWKYADSLESVPSLLDMLKILLQKDLTQELCSAAKDSGKAIAGLFKNRLCLNREDLIISSLEDLIEVSLDEEEIPDLYLDIIHGKPLKKSSLRKLSELNPEDFYNITPLHIAALSGNLEAISFLKKEDSISGVEDESSSSSFGYALDVQDRNLRTPFEYALAYCRSNGINLGLLKETCSDDILNCVQDCVDEVFDSVSDKALILDSLIYEFGSEVIESNNSELFIEAAKKGYSNLLEELNSDSDRYTDKIIDAVIEDAPYIDEGLIQYLEKDDLKFLLQQASEMDLDSSDRMMFIAQLRYYFHSKQDEWESEDEMKSILRDCRDEEIRALLGDSDSEGESYNSKASLERDWRNTVTICPEVLDEYFKEKEEESADESCDEF